MKIQKNIGGGRGCSGRVGVRLDVNEELKFLRKFKKKIMWGGGGGCRVGGGQDGCERRIEVFVKIHKKKFGGGGVRVWAGGGGGRVWGSGGCERRIEVFMKIPPKKK